MYKLYVYKLEIIFRKDILKLHIDQKFLMNII